MSKRRHIIGQHARYKLETMRWQLFGTKYGFVIATAAGRMQQKFPCRVTNWLAAFTIPF